MWELPKVKVYVEEQPALALEGVRVTIADEARAREPIAEGATAHDGVATLHVVESLRAIAAVRRAIAIAWDPSGRPLAMRSIGWPSGGVIPLPVAYADARAAGLIARKTRHPDQKLAAWLAGQQKRDPKHHPPIDYCVVRTLLGAIADDRSELGKRTRAELRTRLPAATLDRVVDHARRAGDFLARSELVPRGCPHDPADVAAHTARRLLESGSFSTIAQSLLETDPDPRDHLPAPSAGTATIVPYDGWDTKCIDLFHLGQLHGQAADDMQRYYHEPNDFVIVEPPSVRRITIWDPRLQHQIRDVELATKHVDVLVFDGRTGLEAGAIDMAVPTTDAQCLVDLRDDADGLQICAPDVLPGQVVTITGRGFVSAAASVDVGVATWMPPPDGAGRAALRPTAFEHGDGWPAKLDVFGAASGDRIVFEWPAAAGRPGLYALHLTFENTTGKKTVTHRSQSHDTCDLGVTDQLAAPVLYFAVLPPPPAPPLTFEVGRVDCVDMTNPEFIPDDIAVMGSARVARIAYDTSGATPAIQLADAQAWEWDAGDHRFWSDGGDWSPHASILDPSWPSIDLGLDHVLHLDLRLAEIEGDFDRGVLKAISLALVIAACLLLTLIIAAIAAVLIVVLILADLASETLATPVAVGLMAFVVAVAAGLIGGVWGAVFPATLAAAAALIDATVDSVDVLVHEHVFVTGSELALRMSPWRYHDKLWVLAPHVDGNGNVTTDADRTGVVQTYDAQEPSSLRHWQYRLRLDVAPE